MWIFLWIKEGKEPDPKAKPYTTQFSMKPKDVKMYLTTVANYENIILGKTDLYQIKFPFKQN